MAEVKRGLTLTIFAILLVLLAIEDLLKPLLGSGTAMVSGARVQGTDIQRLVKPPAPTLLCDDAIIVLAR